MPHSADSRGDLSNRTAASALVGVVFPMPISPVIRICSPFSFRSRTISIPVTIDCLACSAVIAGPSARFAVPQTIFRCKSFGCCTSVSIPMSTASTCVCSVIDLLIRRYNLIDSIHGSLQIRHRHLQTGQPYPACYKNKDVGNRHTNFQSYDRTSSFDRLLSMQ